MDWSNPEVIYVATWPGWWDEKKIYRSDDAGNTWTDITIPSSMLNGYLSRSYDISVSSYDEINNAKENLSIYKKKLNNELWILKH